MNKRTGILAVAVGLVGLLVAVVLTTSAEGIDPESDEEIAAKVASIDAELAELREAGLDESSEVYQSLVDDRTYVLDSALVDPTDPAKAAQELGEANEISVVPSGEALCQAIPPWRDVYPDNSRCVYIARSTTDYLYLFLSDFGKALVFHFSNEGPTMEEESIPALPDLELATLSVDPDGSVRVSIGDAVDVVIPTSNWGIANSE